MHLACRGILLAGTGYPSLITARFRVTDEGAGVARTDQPPADSLDLAAGEPDADEPAPSRRGLERLRPGHPSSPADAGAAQRARDDPAPGASPPDGADRRPLTDIEHADHVAKVRDLLDKARGEGLSTKLQHTIDRDHEQWSEERAVLQDAIIADVYEAARDVPCDGKAILAGGLPGAGKTTTLERHAGIDSSQYLKINPDDVKVEMAKRGMIPEVAGLTPMEASELVHEESSHIAKQLALRAMSDGKNVIWDITMSSRESTEKRIHDLRDFGYTRIDGIFVDIPVEVSIRRAEGRHRTDHDKYRSGEGLGGRYIAPEIVHAQEDPDWGSRNRRTFEQVKPEFDAWKRYDNSVDGRDPVLADSSHREEDTR